MKVTVLPCDRCDRTVDCPCITDPLKVVRARRVVDQRHTDSVRRAYRPTLKRSAA